MAITVTHALLSFAIAGILGATLGLSMMCLRSARWFLDPVVSLGFPIPKIALLPIVLLWLGPGGGTDIAIVAASCLFPVFAAAAGAEGVDKSLLWSAGSMMRQSRPQIFTVPQIALPIALITEIVAEMMLGRDGLGGFMLQSMRFADSPGVFAGIVALGYAVVFAMEGLRAHVPRWHLESDAPA